MKICYIQEGDEKLRSETIEIHNNIFQIVGKRPTCHVYLIKTETKNILIDTGIDINFQMLKETLLSLGLEIIDIDLIINTHEHFDHIGANKYFFEKSLIAAGRYSATKIEQQDEYVTMYGKYEADHYRTKPHIWLENRTLFDLGDIHLKIIETPGHTSGCICIYEPFKRLLFSGDTVFAGGKLSLIAPSGSAGDYINSIERLNTLKINYIFPGHGKISEKPDEDLIIASENAKKKLQDSTAKGKSDNWSESTPIDL